MLVGLVTSAVDRLAFFVEREFLVDAVAVALNVAVQVGNILSDDGSLGVVPRAIANAITRVHGRLAAGGRGAEVSPPRPTTGSRGLCKRLAVTIGACQTAEIGALPRAHAGDEEAHGLTRLLGPSLPKPRMG